MAHSFQRGRCHSLPKEGNKESPKRPAEPSTPKRAAKEAKKDTPKEPSKEAKKDAPKKAETDAVQETSNETPVPGGLVMN